LCFQQEIINFLLHFFEVPVYLWTSLAGEEQSGGQQTASRAEEIGRINETGLERNNLCVCLFRGSIHYQEIKQRKETLQRTNLSQHHHYSIFESSALHLM
jgi:hypothetical protein